MEAAAGIPWTPIGELLVARGLISRDDLEQALAEQPATGRRLGEILVRQRSISSPELTEVLMEQLGRDVAMERGFGTGLWGKMRNRSVASADPQGGNGTVEVGLQVDDVQPDLEPELAVRAERVEGLEAAVRERDRRIADLERAVADITVERDASRALAEDSENDRLVLANSLALQAELDQQLTEVKRQLADLEHEAVALRAALERSSQRIDEDSHLAELVKEVQRGLDSALGERDEAMVLLGKAREERDAARRTADELQERSAEAESRAEAQAATADAAAAELELRVRELDQQLGMLDGILAEERNAHASCQREKAEALELLARVSTNPGGPEHLSPVGLAAIRMQLADEVAQHADTRRALARALDELTEYRNESGCETPAEHPDVFLCMGSDEAGYRLATEAGPLPQLGGTFSLDGKEHVVMKIGASPLPGDPRRCVYLASIG